MHSIFRKKIILISLAVSLWMIAVFWAVWGWKRTELVAAFRASYDEHLTSEFIQTTNDLYTLCRVANEAVRTRVQGALHVASRLLNQQGYEFHGPQAVWWSADGLMESKYPWMLPVLVVGGQKIGPSVNQSKSLLWVDEAADWVEAEVSLYERLSGTSDMLCVATSRASNMGVREVGTRLTWRQADGTLHPALSVILRGGTYIGPMIIGTEHTFAGLSPLYGDDGQVMGALCVAFTQALITPVLKIFNDISIGARGYAWIIYGHDQKPGVYVVNPNNADPAADWRDLRDDNGVAIYERMAGVATNLRQGEVAQNSWRWKDPDESSAFQKNIFFTYFQPWDWVIGITAYEEDFNFMTPQNRDILLSVRVALLIAMLMALIVAVFAAWIFSNKSVDRCVELAQLCKRAAEGDLKGAQLGLVPERWLFYKGAKNATELTTLYDGLFKITEYCQALK
ncbi:MAG TPA: Cache 3/Cache 2 fusion domain-containing protein, partial [Opitutales bacterium]|nr:Cache 3/Cache 2 fusion domain-containing protein [Opitutales bacterium]